MNREEYIRRLLDKYNRQACDEKELDELYTWLEEQATAGEPWDFETQTGRDIIKHRIQRGVTAAMEGRSLQSLSGRGTKPGEEARPGEEAKGRLPKVLTLFKYTAAAAAMFFCIWGANRLNHLFRKPQDVILTAAAGQVEKAVLPDGSTVWLNNNTELAYHNDEQGGRLVELRRGEAFFDVKKDPAHVFEVRTSRLTTRVLGTSFSAKMVGNAGDLKVTVVTGKVMVSGKKDTLGMLQSNQRLRYDAQSGKAVIDSVLNGEADGWVHGDLFLQDASLEEVIQWLQDHYKVTIYNKRPAYRGNYYLQVKSDIPLPEVIKILDLLGKKDHVQFSLQGKTISIL